MNRPIVYWNWDKLFAGQRATQRSRRVYRRPSIQHLSQRAVFDADLEAIADPSSDPAGAAYVYTPGSSAPDFYGPVQPSVYGPSQLPIYGPVQPFEQGTEPSGEYGALLASTYAPSSSGSIAPSPSDVLTSPSYAPTPSPSYEPTPSPSYEPTPSPSYEPTPSPSYEPTPSPSYEPTPTASYSPTPSPSNYTASISAKNAAELKGTPKAEDRGSITVTLNRPVGSGEEPLWISFEISSGGTNPATPGMDYQLLGSTTLIFHPGESSKSVEVEIINDLKVEGDESIVAILTELPERVSAGSAQAILTISDNDYWDWADTTGDGVTAPPSPSTQDLGNYRLTPNQWTKASKNTSVAYSGATVVEYVGIIAGVFGAGAFDTYTTSSSASVDAEITASGDITAHVSGRTLSDVKRLGTAIGVDVAIDESSDTERTVTVTYQLFVGVLYEYTQTSTLEASGSLAGGSAKISIGQNKQVNDSSQTTDTATYIMRAIVREM